MQQTPSASTSSPLVPSDIGELTMLKAKADDLFHLASYGEAEHTYRKLIDLRAQQEGTKATYRDQYNLSATLVKQRKFHDAEATLREVLPFLTSRAPEGAPEHFGAQEGAAYRLLDEAMAGRRGGEE